MRYVQISTTLLCYYLSFRDTVEPLTLKFLAGAKLRRRSQSDKKTNREKKGRVMVGHSTIVREREGEMQKRGKGGLDKEGGEREREGERES